MKKHVALSLCLLLAGCTDADWNHVMSLGGTEEAEATPVETAQPGSTGAKTVAVPAAEAASADFCHNVAIQEAGSNEFDRPTRSRLYADSYAQCVAMYTR